MGSFHIGGRVVELQGQPVQTHRYSDHGVPVVFNLNGRYWIEQMYVQYFEPSQRHAVPLLLWHGGGMTGVNYESTPDGRDGWLQHFLRSGWMVYNCDAVERGRAGWPALPESPWPTAPVLMSLEHAVERFRIAQGETGQFPVTHLDVFGKQLTPRWTSTDEATQRAYAALLQRTGPSAIVAHSQGGSFAVRVACEHPGQVRALVLVEPANPETTVPDLHGIPVLMVYGDGIAQDSRWPHIHRKGLAFAESLRAAGGQVDVLDLPSVGLHGNTHMLMMDRNNHVIFRLINDWLLQRKLQA